jgi:signal transduction histidine kinase
MQSNNTKDKFFSILAHDLRNPFITILGFSDLLLNDYNDLTDKERLFYVEEMKSLPRYRITFFKIYCNGHDPQTEESISARHP